MSDISKRLTLAQIKDTQEYSILTGKQQLFCETYIQGGIDTGTYEPIDATMTAYKCKSRENARVMSYALMSNIRIIAVLNRHFNREPIEEFLIQIDRAIQNKKLRPAQLQALKLKGDILGYTTRLPGTNNFPIGTIPPDVQKNLEETRKAKKAKPVRTLQPEPTSPYSDR
jgi:hypothetical protein